MVPACFEGVENPQALWATWVACKRPGGAAQRLPGCDLVAQRRQVGEDNNFFLPKSI
jgi:hypothetical protein